MTWILTGYCCLICLFYLTLIILACFKKAALGALRRGEYQVSFAGTSCNSRNQRCRGDVARTKIVYILVTDVGILSDDIVGNIDKITAK